MAFLASNELDGVEEKHLSQAPRSLSAFPLPQAQTQLLGAIIRLWPLGLVLANAAVGVRGFQRKLVVWACLQLPSSSPSSYPVQTAQEQAGVTSIRALPQVSRVMGWMAVLPTTALGPPHPTVEGRRQSQVYSRRTRAVLTLPAGETRSLSFPPGCRLGLVPSLQIRIFQSPFSLFKNCF